jgi:tetraacyldisaccharide 4'-kinase
MTSLRSRVEAGVTRYWRGEATPLVRLFLTVVTAPLSLVFGAIVRLRARGFETGLLRAESVPVPVISVGNLSVGGTGKTPVTRWIMERAQALGVRPGVVARGYGEDELALHRRWSSDLPVVADADRVRGAHEAIRGGAELLVLDDGFQHRRLARDADIVLLSAHDPIPFRLLPWGPYRELPDALRRASLVLVTGHGRRASLEGAEGALLHQLRALPQHPPLGELRLVPDRWTDLSGGVVDPPDPAESLVVLSSVARPEEVLRVVRESLAEDGGEEEAGPRALRAFPDHYAYSAADVRDLLRWADGRRIVTTEKDAVKLLPFLSLFPAERPPRVLTLRVEPGEGTERLLDRLLYRIRPRTEFGP